MEYCLLRRGLGCFGGFMQWHVGQRLRRGAHPNPAGLAARARRPLPRKKTRDRPRFRGFRWVCETS